MSATLLRAAAVAGGLVALLAGCARAQAEDARRGIAARVQAVRDGEVRMHFASRPGVCGSVRDDGGVQINTGRGGRRSDGGSTVVVDGSYVHGDNECVEGPVHVRLIRRGGTTYDVSTRVARGWAASGGERVVDLGRVGVREASDYLLGMAETAEDGEVGKDAIFPATLADSVTTWPRLLRMARSDGVARRTRESAVFWLSNQAGDEVTKGLREIVDDDGDREVRQAAVFALSRRPREEAVPELIRIARTHRDPEIRRNAMFWLGRTGDPRAIALFEEILSN